MSESVQEIESTSEVTENAQEYLGDSSPVSSAGWARDEAYFVQAVRQGGLPVDIVSVSVNNRYQPLPVVDAPNYKAGMVTSQEPLESITADLFSQITFSFENEEFQITDASEEKWRVEHFGFDYTPQVFITYKTQSGNLFRATVEKEIYGASDVNNRYPGQLFFVELIDAVELSDMHSSIADISQQNPLSATLEPETDLSDGLLTIDDAELSIDCESVDFVEKSDACRSKLTFIAQTTPAFSKYQRDDSDEGQLREWYWGYVSDVREKPDGETVLLTVSTPLQSAVVPFNMSHDEDKNNLWKLIDHAGGDLQDVRGIDVCVRLRGRDSPIAKAKYNHSNVRRASVDRNNIQPVKSIEKEGVQFIEAPPTDITPIAVDTDYLWNIGLPSKNRFEREHNNLRGASETRDKDENTKKSEQMGIIERIFG